MTADPAGSASEVSYAIAYQAFAGSGYNLDFKGRGTLTIHSDGPRYVFSGRPQRIFARKPIEWVLTADDISNVAVKGRVVYFNTPRGKSGKQNRPFLFLCQDETEARTVAGLLPAQVDADFVAEHDFRQQLRTMSAASPPWASVTNQLIAVNVIVFVVMAGLLGAGWFEVASLAPYARFGANNGAATTDGEWWRLVTCMFLHYGIVHLAFNMWALFQVGHLVEKLLGRLLFTLAYFGSGIISSLASIAWHGDKIWSAGASGAIFGIYGTLLGYMWREKHALPKNFFQPLLKSTLAFAGYNIIYGLAHPGIDNSAHIGGVLAGVGLGWLIAVPIDAKSRMKLVRPRFWLGLTAVCAVVALGVALTPRFDYSMHDEIAWENAFQGFEEKEQQLLKHNNELLQQYQVSEQTGADYARWITTELAPFYAQRLQQLAALKFEPGRLTDRRRKIVEQAFQTKLAGYQHLVNGVEKNDSAEIERYVAAEQDVQRQLAQLSK